MQKFLKRTHSHIVHVDVESKVSNKLTDIPNCEDMDPEIV